jgi:parvulin-like peptidyl-prolyl isomerase
VNGEYIFLTDYERRVAQYEQALADQGLDPAQARDEVLNALIDGALIQQGAAALGIELSDEELDKQIETDIATGGGQEAFDQWLQATGQTREDYREMLRQSLIAQRALQAVTAGLSANPEQVHARHIQVESEEAAREILSQLQQGADFAALARERSTDLATQENGGDLGWFPRGMVALELENAAFALQPGEVSDVLYLGEGFHLIQVVEREAARPLSAEMLIEWQQAAFERWLADLRDAATIIRFAAQRRLDALASKQGDSHRSGRRGPPAARGSGHGGGLFPGARAGKRNPLLAGPHRRFTAGPGSGRPGPLSPGRFLRARDRGRGPGLRRPGDGLRHAGAQPGDDRCPAHRAARAPRQAVPGRRAAGAGRRHVPTGG